MEQEKDGAAKCETIQATAPNSFKEGSIRELHAGEAVIASQAAGEVSAHDPHHQADHEHGE